MAKISKEEWIKAGLEVLRKESQAALKVDRLCSRLDISKGSFYHHFKNLEDYIDALLKYNYEKNTQSIMLASQNLTSADEKLEALRRFVKLLDPQLEVALRAWSTQHPIVRKHQKKIDKMRTQYLYELIQGLGIEKDKARQYAKIQYALFVGLMSLKALNPKEKLTDLVFIYEEILKK